MHKYSWVFLSLLFVGTTTTILAQKTAIYTNELADFNRAVTLYKDKQYLAAQLIFDKVKQVNLNQDVQADCTYYSANCAIRLNQQGADRLMEDFVTNYPTSSKQNQAYIEVAHYYFEQGQYPQALEWFDKVDESGLSSDEIDQFNFQKGYSFFTAKNKKEATKYFNSVANSKEYGSQAKYYLGFMAYEADDYKEATKQFDQVSGEEKYKEKMSYFQADMNFKLGNFQKAIDDGICPEQARFMLPQGVEVNWVWTGSLYAFANFYNQRSDSHAQKEVQDLAEQVNQIIQPLFPVSWSALTQGNY